MKFKTQITSLAIALLTVLIFASCGGDDSDNPDIPSALLGIWEVTSSQSTNCTDPDDNGTEEFTCDGMNCLTVEFRSDGTLTSTDLFDGEQDSEEGTYVIVGDQLTVTIDTEITVTTFNVSGNTLMLSIAESGGCDNTTTLIKR